MPMSEAEKYRAQLDDAIEKAGGSWDRTFALMRHTSVYKNEEDRTATMTAIRNVLGKFGNLMMKKGDVINGFPENVPLEELEGNVRVDPQMLEENLMFGSPETVIGKLRQYEAMGINSYIYYASMGLDRDVQKRSLQTFIDEVMPAFN